MDKIVQTQQKLIDRYFTEICPHCGNQTRLSINNLNCRRCNTAIKPCALCNNQGCDECKVIAVRNRIAIFHRNASKQTIYIEEFYKKGGNNQ